MIRLLLAMVSIVALGGYAKAGEPITVSLSDAVAGHSGVTYFNLVSLFETRQTLSLDVSPDPALPYADIVARIRKEGLLDDIDRGDEEPQTPYTRSAAVTYQWNDAEQRFIADSDALDQIARLSSERF